MLFLILKIFVRQNCLMDAGATLRSEETRVQVTEVIITQVILEIEDVEAANRHE